ncbi:MAG: DUF5673 domain-containing protein, partial [Spirulina sp.]
LPWMLLGLAIACSISLFGKYGWVSFCIFYAVGVGILILSWVFQKQKAGILLLDIGKNAQNKFFLWIGLFEVVGASIMTWSFFEGVSQGFLQSASLSTEVAQLTLFWSFAVFFVALGLNKLELREKGICFMSSFIAWQRIESYSWEKLKPNTLTIRFQPRYPLFPGFMSMAIPARHKDAVSHILNERLPDKNLFPQR